MAKWAAIAATIAVVVLLSLWAFEILFETLP